MNPKLTVPPLQKSTKKTNKLLIILLGVLLFVGIGFGLYIVTQQQVSTNSRADEAAGTITPTVTVTPTEAVPTGPSCPANGATCSWDAVPGATSYSFVITDRTINQGILVSNTSLTSVSFTAVVDHLYECSVKAVNECGQSDNAAGRNTCVSGLTPTVPVVTPTTPVTPTVTITPTTGPTATPTTGPSATPTTGPSATPTTGPSATPTTGPSATPTDTVVAESTPTTVVEPTLPTAGSTSSIYFMVVSTILVVTLFLVF